MMLMIEAYLHNHINWHINIQAQIYPSIYTLLTYFLAQIYVKVCPHLLGIKLDSIRTLKKINSKLKWWWLAEKVKRSLIGDWEIS